MIATSKNEQRPQWSTTAGLMFAPEVCGTFIPKRFCSLKFSLNYEIHTCPHVILQPTIETLPICHIGFRIPCLSLWRNKTVWLSQSPIAPPHTFLPKSTHSLELRAHPSCEWFQPFPVPSTGTPMGMSGIRVLGTAERVVVWIHRDRGKSFYKREVAQDQKAVGSS